MIHILGKIPKKVNVAVSGGPDSMAVLNFLSNNHQVTAAYFNHGTDFSKKALKTVEKYTKKNNIPLVVGEISRTKKKTESQEEYWSNERNKWFKSFFPDTIITAHNLDDAVEWYIFTALHGDARLIPYKNENIIRPFLITTKKELLSWIKRKNIPFLLDPANKNRDYMRSIIRHDIVPEALKINPGLHKVIKKKLMAKHKDKKNI